MFTVLCFAILCCFLRTGDATVSKLGTNGCQIVNAETDNNLQIANSLMISHNFAIVDVDDFSLLSLPLRIFGWRLPWNVTLKASTGLLGFGNLSRSGIAVGCSTELTSLLYSELAYDYVKFRYTDATVSFRNWEVDGQLSYKFRPSLNVTLAKDSTFGCRVASSPMRSVEGQAFEYQSNSWKGWLLGKLFQHALWYAADTPMTSYFQQASHSLIGTFFVDQWCTTQ